METARRQGEYGVLRLDDTHFDILSMQPSHLTAFNQLVKLYGILSYAMRTVYSVNKSKAHLGFIGHEWEARTGELKPYWEFDKA